MNWRTKRAPGTLELMHFLNHATAGIPITTYFSANNLIAVV